MSIHFIAVMPGKKSKPEQKIVVIDDKLCMTTCNNCGARNLSIAHFAPKPTSNNSCEKFHRFMQACDNGDCKIIKSEGFCVKDCKSCRNTNFQSKKRTNGQSEMVKKNIMVEKIKEDMEIKGCEICGCFDRESLQADHPNRENKKQKVQDARHWKTADEMWSEYQKCQVLCSVCHMLQPSHNGALGENSANMPKGNNSHSSEYKAKSARENKEKMNEYNRKRKQETGTCKHCDLDVLEGTERAFSWTHRDQGATGNIPVSKLCENTYNEKNIKKIDDEIEKCDLLCTNCHKQFLSHEHFKVYLPVWDKLIERGVTKPKDWDSWQQQA